MYLSINNLTKKYGEFVALDDVSIAFEEHEFVCLLGPSGCGKTTLLRVIAGLTDFDEGEVLLKGGSLAGVAARKRGFGIVFQSYSLFPNMTIAENIGYGLKIRQVPKAQIAERVNDLLETVKLPHLADRFPWQLSGGQQQRIALARAIAVDPSVLLLDEPLSALDAKVRTELRSEIRQLQRKLGIPTLMVTHDQEEALALADKIVCMNHGSVVQSGTPEELYLKPATRFVADFMGTSNLIDTPRVRQFFAHLLQHRPAGDDDAYIACVRPEHIRLQPADDGDAIVRSITFLGNLRRIEVESPAGQFTVETQTRLDVVEGQRSKIDIPADTCCWVANDGEASA